MRRNAEMARTTDLEAMTGNLLDIVAHVADVVDSFGERLSAGDVIITGSITIIIDPDESIDSRDRTDWPGVSAIFGISGHGGSYDQCPLLALSRNPTEPLNVRFRG